MGLEFFFQRVDISWWTRAFSTCRPWELVPLVTVSRFFRSVSSPIPRLIVLKAGFPATSNKEGVAVYHAYWPLLLTRRFPTLPSRVLRPAMYRGAQERINQGTVVFMQLELGDSQHTFTMFVQGGVSKNKMHPVCAQLENGQLMLPECNCPMSGGREEKMWCQHMLMVPLLIQRIRLGFESIQYESKRRDPYHKEERLMYKDFDHIMAVAAEKRRILRNAARVLQKENRFEGTKLAYLKTYNLSTYDTAPFPLWFRSPTPIARPKVAKTRRPAQSKRHQSHESEPNGPDDEAASAVVPHKTRKRLENSIYSQLDKVDGRKHRRRK